MVLRTKCEASESELGKSTVTEEYKLMITEATLPTSNSELLRKLITSKISVLNSSSREFVRESVSK